MAKIGTGLGMRFVGKNCWWAAKWGRQTAFVVGFISRWHYCNASIGNNGSAKR